MIGTTPRPYTAGKGGSAEKNVSETIKRTGAKKGMGSHKKRNQMKKDT